MPELLSPLELSDEPEGEPEETVAVDDLDAVRELVLRAHPDVVPELVTGHSVADLIASVESAKAAYAKLAEEWSGSYPEPVSVPAGGGGVLPVDPASLPAAEKIRRGLQSMERRKAHKE